jgi:hypothetical protein
VVKRMASDSRTTRKPAALMPVKEELMSRTKVRFVLCLLLICSTAAVVPASAQHFQQMEGSLTQIAAGRVEVWGLDGAQPYRFNPNTQKFVKISDKVSGSLSQIAVGGGTLLQLDEVWELTQTATFISITSAPKSLIEGYTFQLYSMTTARTGVTDWLSR